MLISDEEFEQQLKAAEKRGKASDRIEPKAVSIKHENGFTTINLSAGWSFTFNPQKFSELANATEDELMNIQVLGAGNTIEWTDLDAHMGVDAIILELLGKDFLQHELARRNGQVKSVRKALAARSNGKKGGRPKKEQAA